VVVNEFFNNTGQIRDDFIFIKTLSKIGIEKVCTSSSFALALPLGSGAYRPVARYREC
jgi:hypothetical protein